MTKWINVKDKLPQKGQLCLFFCKSKIPDAQYEIGRFINFTNLHIAHITHWAELPEAPHD